MKSLNFKVNNTELIEYKKKMMARKIVGQMIRQKKLFRASICELCSEAKQTEAHHTDYGRPIDVMWLCDSCHGLVHRNDSIYNPKNIYQTPIPLAWGESESVTVSFTLPAKNFIAMKKFCDQEKTCISKVIRKCVLDSYQVESNQLNFNFEENHEKLHAIL